MKTKMRVLAVTGLLVILALIFGAGLVDTGWFSSSAASAESESVEILKNDTEYLDLNFASENINQILREFNALAEYRVFDFASENINQTLRAYDAANRIEDQGVELEAESVLGRGPTKDDCIF